MGSDGTRSREETCSSSGSDANEDDGEEPQELDLQRVMAEAEARRERREEHRQPGVWLPDVHDLDRVREHGDETHFDRDTFSGSTGNRQLGLRLRPTHFDQLCEVAELYGVRPTTLARMMVIRGVKAVLEAERRRTAHELREEW